MTKQILFMKPVTNHSIAQLIRGCQNQTEVEILLDCGTGGDPYSALAFYTFIQNSSLKLTVNVISRCISAGIYLLCAGRIRKATTNAIFLIHPNRRGFHEQLTRTQMKWQFESMTRLDKNLLGIIRSTCKQPLKKLTPIYWAESELTAQQVFDLGLLTEMPY